MLKEPACEKRSCRVISIECDLAIVGGGLASVCAAITAARAGLKVTLLQDRPVLGGNASSEVRLWVLGATSHMGNNNRWAREGGVIDEILVENLYRNPEGNPLIVDSILLEKVLSEPNITLLLDTAAYEVDKSGPDVIRAVHAFCPQNETVYHVHAPLFCDASGDGIVGFLAGAAFRMGAESADEFGEKFAPSEEYGQLLGHSMYFYSKDAGRPVKFIPPSFALDDITQIPRFGQFNSRDFGCRLWWIEYGGRLDTIHDSQKIKMELWKIVYGVWNYIKNSGKFPDAANLTLEWVGQIPGKRESRRFEGDYMLIQQDIVEQRRHDDDVSFGGWSIDLHPADGVYSDKPGCNQWHSRGVYPIPYRCMYSRNIRNLFLAGRIISASHVAFGSSRVMATCAHGAQAVGMAAAICRRTNALPAQLNGGPSLRAMQRDLMRVGQYIPGLALRDEDDLAQTAAISATSRLQLAELPADGPLLPLRFSWAMMLPVKPGPMPQVEFIVNASGPTNLNVELRFSEKPENHTPDRIIAGKTFRLAQAGEQTVRVKFDAAVDRPRYAFVCLMANEQVQVRCSRKRLTGVLAVSNRYNPAVAKSSLQKPPGDIGVDTFEFWTPSRRPEGHNLAIKIEPPLDAFDPANVTNGNQRPIASPNAWLAAWDDARPTITLQWEQPQRIARIELGFDADWDHPAESVLMGHPESVMPFCVRAYRVRDERGELLAERRDNHQTRNTIQLKTPVTTRKLVIEIDHPSADAPAALFEVRCYK